jgi:hypothetical protein
LGAKQNSGRLKNKHSIEKDDGSLSKRGIHLKIDSNSHTQRPPTNCDTGRTDQGITHEGDVLNQKTRESRGQGKAGGHFTHQKKLSHPNSGIGTMYLELQERSGIKKKEKEMEELYLGGSRGGGNRNLNKNKTTTRSNANIHIYNGTDKEMQGALAERSKKNTENRHVLIHNKIHSNGKTPFSIHQTHHTNHTLKGHTTSAIPKSPHPSNKYYPSILKLNTSLYTQNQVISYSCF